MLPHSCESDGDSNASKDSTMANIVSRIAVNFKSFADRGSQDCKIDENLNEMFFKALPEAVLQ